MDTKNNSKIPNYGDLPDLSGHNVVVGAKQLRKALKNSRVRCVFLAENAVPDLTEPLERECRSHGVPVRWVRTMQDLGRMCKIEVGAAAAAIVD